MWPPNSRYDPQWQWIRKTASSILAVGQYLAVVSTATGIAYGVMAYERETSKREQERISAAWSLIADTKSRGQGNLGLNEALQSLNDRGVDLSRIQLPNAYLAKVN